MGKIAPIMPQSKMNTAILLIGDKIFAYSMQIPMPQTRGKNKTMQNTIKVIKDFHRPPFSSAQGLSRLLSNSIALFKLVSSLYSHDSFQLYVGR